MATTKAKAKVSKAGQQGKGGKPGKSGRREESLTRLIEELVAKGADTAEEINRAVLDLPVSVLDSLGMEQTAEDVKQLQDRSIGAVYQLIRDVNSKVADLAADVLEERRGRTR